jgi:hypothetical protein
VIGFFLATVGPELRSLAGEVSKLFPMVLVWGSLGFVPILFFSKSEIRRLISRMACWQSGYIWLFALYFPEKILNSVSLFAISQGIFIAIIFQSAVSLCGADDLDFVESVGGTFEKNYFPAIFLGSSLMLLVAMPAVFMCKRNMPSMQSALVYQVIGSVVLPIVFSFRVHWSMRGGSGAKC